MELTVLVLIASAVAIILQLVVIASLNGLKKKVQVIAESKGTSNIGSRPERKDHDFQRNRRPQEQRPHKTQVTTPAAPAASVGADPVEKSLRDINLKLKNAERDQEFARKKLQGDLPRESRREPGERIERSERGDHSENRGPRRDSRRDNREGRESRDNRRGSWQERRDNQQPQGIALPPKTEAREETSFEMDAKPIEQIADITPTTQGTDLQATDFGTSDENLQHGRKFQVKRRVLKDGETEQDVSEETEVQSQENIEAEPQHTEAEASMESEDKTVDSEIKFGRR